jgi:hypothetical protein
MDRVSEDISNFELGKDPTRYEKLAGDDDRTGALMTSFLLTLTWFLSGRE